MNQLFCTIEMAFSLMSCFTSKSLLRDHSSTNHHLPSVNMVIPVFKEKTQTLPVWHSLQLWPGTPVGDPKENHRHFLSDFPFFFSSPSSLPVFFFLPSRALFFPPSPCTPSTPPEKERVSRKAAAAAGGRRRRAILRRRSTWPPIIFFRSHGYVGLHSQIEVEYLIVHSHFLMISMTGLIPHWLLFFITFLIFFLRQHCWWLDVLLVNCQAPLLRQLSTAISRHWSHAFLQLGWWVLDGKVVFFLIDYNCNFRTDI